MRIAWLAPYNLRLLEGRLPPIPRHVHPAPWITNGLRALNETGAIELHVVTIDKALDRDYEFESDGVTFHVLYARHRYVPRALVRYRLDLPRLQEVLRRIRPDLVHGHGTENMFSLAAVLSGYPHIVSMQAIIAELIKTQPLLSRSAIHYAFVRSIERRTLKLASCVLVEAPFVTDIITKVNPRLRTKVVGNIVSPEYFRVTRAPDVIRSRVLVVGSLVEAKGVAEAITAFHRVVRDWPRLELHVVGTGQPQYVRVLQELGRKGAASSRIVFRGFLSPSEIAAEHAGAAMVVVPTHYDTSPNVVAEALVAGVPVVASSVGGLPYMLDEGKAGRLVPARDPDALAEAIDWTLRHPAEANAAAAHGQRLARARYSPESFATAVMNVYREALGVDEDVHRR